MKTLTWSGQRLAALRLKRGWSQDELARATHTSVTNISRYERDKHTPGGHIVQRLAAALEVEASEFYENGDEDDEESDPVLVALLSAHARDTASAYAIYEALKPRLRDRAEVERGELV